MALPFPSTRSIAVAVVQKKSELSLTEQRWLEANFRQIQVLFDDIQTRLGAIQVKLGL